MILDFMTMEETKIQQFYGGELETWAKMFSDENNRIMKGKLATGASIGEHLHETSSEIIFVLQGTGKIMCDEKFEVVSKGQCHYCAKGHSHSLRNDEAEDLIFIAVVPQQ